jgi:hypothetical protein
MAAAVPIRNDPTAGANAKPEYNIIDDNIPAPLVEPFLGSD